MTEMYTMQRYLQYETLRKNGLAHFDCWASTFGETTTAIELAPEGTGYRARTRFAKFHNLPELMCMFKEVADIKTADMITRYVTEGTFDAYLYQTIENKQKFISQIMSSKSPVRSCEDVDETALSYAEIKALCAGNPLIKEKMDLDIEVARLRLLKADHQSQLYRLEDDLLTNFPQAIERAKEQVTGFKDDQARLDAGTQPNKDGFSPMEIHGVVYADKEKAGAALLEACKKITEAAPVKIGTYRGLDLNLSFDTLHKTFHATLKGSMSYGTDLGTDVFGNITRLNNAVGELPQRLTSVQKQLENLHQQVKNAEQEKQKPFAFETELADKAARLAFLDAELNMDASHEQRGPEQISLDGFAAKDRAASAKAKPSILESLKAAAPSARPAPDNAPDKAKRLKYQYDRRYGMPRLSKKMKLEWSFFIGPNGRRQYNILCRRCQYGCKQSFRAIIVDCPKYRSKRENCIEKVPI